jgi:6-phosphogluconolactonase
MSRISLVSATLLATSCSLPLSARAATETPGIVYTASNASSGNAIIAFQRTRNGSLTPLGSTPTGGLGTGAGLANGRGLVLSADGQWLLVVNAGSNNFTLFQANESGLVALATVPSQGAKPVSIAVNGDLIYVLNTGSDSIAGFSLDEQSGTVTPLPNSVRPLSGTNVGGAEIAFSPDGRFLVTTERTTSRITIYGVETSGLPSATPKVYSSQGQTPFGFAFDNERNLLVTNAAGGASNASSVSSYHLSVEGNLNLLQGSVATNQTSACWIAVTPGGRYAYTANTPAGTITAFDVGANGSLTLENASGVAANPGSGSKPIDLGVDAEGRFLYVLDSGVQTISAYSVAANGSLTPLAASYGGLPSSANGLAVR